MGLAGFLIALLIVSYIVLPMIPQGIGTFGSEWIKEASCLSINPIPSCCHMTNLNISSCGSSFDLEELDAASHGIEIASFGLFNLQLFWGVLHFVLESKDVCARYLRVFRLLTFISYFTAGLLSFVGCMVIIDKYSGQTLGSSFYYTLPCGPTVFVLTCLGFCSIFCEKKDKCNPLTTMKGARRPLLAQDQQQ